MIISWTFSLSQLAFTPKKCLISLSLPNHLSHSLQPSGCLYYVLLHNDLRMVMVPMKVPELVTSGVGSEASVLVKYLVWLVPSAALFPLLNSYPRIIFNQHLHFMEPMFKYSTLTRNKALLR